MTGMAHVRVCSLMIAALCAGLFAGCQSTTDEPAQPTSAADVGQDVKQETDGLAPADVTPPSDLGPTTDVLVTGDATQSPDVAAPESDASTEDASTEDASTEDASAEDASLDVGEGPEATCGDGACEQGESAASCPEDCDLTDPLSCAGICGVYQAEAPCQCDGYCDEAEDCCDDICEACPSTSGLKEHCGQTIPDSCEDRCGLFDSEAACQCDPACKAQGDCCEDLCAACSEEPAFEDLCAPTCAALDACGEYDESAACQCDFFCLSEGDCCADYCETCGDEACDEVTETCGDDTCSETESSLTCPEDCGAIITCGDDVCEGFEDPIGCPEDCKFPASCGNSICEEGDTFATCALDCTVPQSCGDSVCNGEETFLNCSEDCPFFDFCGDGICTGGETPATCPDDCPVNANYCGDGECSSDETPGSCWKDCISPCGDGLCMGGWPNQNETWETCPQDCPGGCGECYSDFECTYGESQTTFCLSKTDECTIPVYFDPGANAEYYGWCSDGASGPTIQVLCGNGGMWSYDCSLTGQKCQHVYKGAVDGKSLYGPECVDP